MAHITAKHLLQALLLLGLLSSPVLLFTHPAASATMGVGITELVSVSSTSEQGNAESMGASISADGRFVAFYSAASNLVAGDTNFFCDNNYDNIFKDNCSDIFIHDRQTGSTERVSVSSSGEQGNGNSYDPSVSSDGRFVAFRSLASNLVSGDTNEYADIFVRDRQTGVTERVSISSTGEQGNLYSALPSISANGRFVAFQSWASNLVSGDVNTFCDNNWDFVYEENCRDAFVHDRLTGTTELVSISSTDEQGNSNSDDPSITADGRFVVFGSNASNLVDGDTNENGDIFVHDRQTGVTERVSLSSTGEQANGLNGYYSISADGRFVSFYSSASNMVSGDTNESGDIFVRDRQTEVTERVSISSTGEQANRYCYFSSISADGRFVAFYSDAYNLVSGDTEGTWDIFVRDRQTGVTELVSVATNYEYRAESFDPSISGDGRFVAFESKASNLVVSDDKNGYRDIFVRARCLDGVCPQPPTFTPTVPPTSTPTLTPTITPTPTLTPTPPTSSSHSQFLPYTYK